METQGKMLNDAEVAESRTEAENLHNETTERECGEASNPLTPSPWSALMLPQAPPNVDQVQIPKQVPTIDGALIPRENCYARVEF